MSETQVAMTSPAPDLQFDALPAPQVFGAEFALLPADDQAVAHKTAHKLIPRAKPEGDPVTEYVSQLAGMGKAVKRAEKNGFKIVRGNPNVLLLDLDNGAVLNQPVFEMLCKLAKEVPALCSWMSKSGGTHVLLRFAERTFKPIEAVAYEAALGSDLMRAALYVKRIENGVEDPRVLFMPAHVVGIPRLVLL